VRDYYERVYRPDAAVIVVIGDVTPARARAAIESAFGGWRASGSPAPSDLPPVPLNGGGRVSLDVGSEQQDVVTLAQLVPVVRDDPRSYALDVANTVFGGGANGPSTSRLFRDLRQNTGLVYAIDTSLAVGKTRSSFEIEYAALPQNADRAKAFVLRDVGDLRTKLVSNEELTLAKAAMVRRALLAEADETTIAEDLVARALERRPLDGATTAAKRYLETSAQSLRAAFAALVRPDAFVEVVEGPR
jgi:zinc protease